MAVQGVQRSALTAADLASLMESVGYSDEDVANLRIAGEVLQDQTQQIVELWRSKIIAHISESGATLAHPGR